MSDRCVQLFFLSSVLVLISRTVSVEDAVLSDEDGDGLADEGETISYTTTLRNAGNVRLEIEAVSHSLAQDTLSCDKGFQDGTGSPQVMMKGII